MKETLQSSSSTLRRCIAVFSSRDRKKIGAVALLQILLGGLDLLGVMLIGIIGGLAVTGIQSGSPGNRVSEALRFLNLQGLTFQQQTAILGIAATLVLIGRTILSVIFTRKVLFFIGRRSAVISKDLITKLFQQNILTINSRTIQETIYASTNGVVSVTLGVVGTAVSAIADISLLLVMALGLFVVDPIIAISAFLLFAGVGLALFQLMQARATKFGNLDAELNIRSNEKIAEVLTSYREATVRNRRDYYAEEIGTARLELSDVLAELNFMPSISKYVIEGTMVIGAVSISALQFALQDSKHAIATLAVFLAAGTRIAPAILRVQQGAITIKSALGSAKPTLDLLDSLEYSSDKTPAFEPNFHNTEVDCRIKFENVTFKYPKAHRFALEHLNLDIKPGSSVAIVGPSGSGKTTLVDILLGMFSPSNGKVSIGNLSPLEFIATYPGAIGYVPQDVVIIDGTIRQNIAMGFPIEMATDERVSAALLAAHLLEFVENLPNGFDSIVGPRGSKLSGGQRQRLGIARAMFTVPKLLVLDESTSALDAQTEVQVSNAIAAIPYSITKVVIAHRLSTVRNADEVLYIDNGKIASKGTFDEIRQAIPDFDKQAKLMGIT